MLLGACRRLLEVGSNMSTHRRHIDNYHQVVFCKAGDVLIFQLCSVWAL